MILFVRPRTLDPHVGFSKRRCESPSQLLASAFYFHSPIGTPSFPDSAPSPMHRCYPHNTKSGADKQMRASGQPQYKESGARRTGVPLSHRYQFADNYMSELALRGFRDGRGVMKLLFLDESGDHNLAKIDLKYPVFVLGGIIVDRTYARTVMQPRIQQLKLDFFGDPGIILHTNDILRARNGFEDLKDSAFREEFYEALNVMMRELEYQVVACVIDKPRLVAQYGSSADDPYHFSLHVLIERFCKELGECVDGGMIYAEKRGEPLDHELNLAWERLRSTGGGTNYAGSKMIDERICELVVKDKRLNIAGLQLADLVIAPIARKGAWLPVKEDWEIVKSKFRRSTTGKWRGYGLVYLPKVPKKMRGQAPLRSA
jgi:hypothetical protein